ncbi:hypothetical protein LshimejAT787_0210970 [Lyophyllum shimeji]|uniref:Polysaccharide lyase 14 domain-containing protein n=1 Tax=Lyophyllum shimeji TaxID=47721 RepID=A0A9P3UJK1_LYOSH|nr:hypothetical protein LshimejAT787_0210970 [Lyophyllum shimeji]
MLAQKTILVVLAAISFTSALPHGRRSCRPHSSIAVPSAVPSAIPDVNGGSNNTSIVKDPSSTATASPSAPAKPTKSESSPPPVKTMDVATSIGALFPVSGYKESWSTASGAPHPLPLSDSTFRPNHLLTSLSHDYVAAPDGKMSMKAHYPKGSYTFTHNPQGGLSFYAPGPANVDLSTAKEATFGYSVFFENGFQFQKGGKLPGLYGGDNDEVAISCSGGRRDTRCFSARLMWRGEGAGEFYTYLPPFTDPRFAANKKQCNVPPLSDCNPTYGASIGRGSFHFPTGQWTTVSERVRLNDVGQANGELELFVNGKSVVNVGGLVLRDSSAGRIRGIQMQTFFGGSHPDFASPKDQNAYFSDFSVAITETL